MLMARYQSYSGSQALPQTRVDPRQVQSRSRKHCLHIKLAAPNEGFGTDDKGEYMAVVLVNPDESTAKANASLLERQIRSSNFDEGKSWAELVTSIETTQDGDLVLAKLYGEAANRWKAFDSAMLGGDPLLMYGG